MSTYINHRFVQFIFLLLPLGIFGLGNAVAQVAGTTQVVYHIDDADLQALKALRNIRNHLDVSPTTKIIVVTHAQGVDFLMEGAKHEKSQTAYAPLVSALSARGVTFEICDITLKNRKLTKDQFVMEASFTPSGVVRLADLQVQQGFAYIKP